MSDEQTPTGEPTPSADPPPLAPLVEQAAAPTPPPIMPPPVAWGAPPAAAAAKGGRTVLAAVAGVMLIILGIVRQLDLSQYGGDFGGINDPAAVVSGAIAFVGILIVVYSLVYLIGGIGIVRTRAWGRVIGLVVGTLSALFWLLGLMGGQSSGIGFALVMLAIHVYVVVVLILFWRMKAA